LLNLAPDYHQFAALVLECCARYLRGNDVFPSLFHYFAFLPLLIASEVLLYLLGSHFLLLSSFLLLLLRGLSFWLAYIGIFVRLIGLHRLARPD
jgi:hypothetical protein